MSKFTNWYNQQNETTKIWLAKQPIWHDKDMFVSAMFGIFIGIFIGLLVGVSL